MLPDLLSIFESTSYTEFNDYYRIWFNFVTNGNFPFYLLFCFGNQLNWQFSYNFFSISITWISNAWQFIYINMDLSYTTTLIRWSEKFIPFFFTTTPKKTTIYWFYKQAFFLVKEAWTLARMFNEKQGIYRIDNWNSHESSESQVHRYCFDTFFSSHISNMLQFECSCKRCYLDHLSNKISCKNIVFSQMLDKKKQKWSQTIGCDDLVDTVNAEKRTMWKIEPALGIHTTRWD